MSRETQTIRSDEILTKKIDQVSPYLKYIGRADFGVADGDYKWQIMRITRVGDVESVEYAFKGSSVGAWSLRSSYFTSFSDPGNTVAKGSFSASTTDGALVTAVTSRKIRVISYEILVGATATTVTFNSKPVGAGTAISMAHTFGVYGGIVAPPKEPWGYFETLSGEGLTVTTSSGSTSNVQIQYQLVG